MPPNTRGPGRHRRPRSRQQRQRRSREAPGSCRPAPSGWPCERADRVRQSRRRSRWLHDDLERLTHPRGGFVGVLLAVVDAGCPLASDLPHSDDERGPRIAARRVAVARPRREQVQGRKPCGSIRHPVTPLSALDQRSACVPHGRPHAERHAAGPVPNRRLCDASTSHRIGRAPTPRQVAPVARCRAPGRPSRTHRTQCQVLGRAPAGPDHDQPDRKRP